MKKVLLMIALMALVASCGSSKKKKELNEESNSGTIQKDYIVRASSTGNIRPAWVYDPIEWAQAKGRDLKKFRYFSFETEPKVNRGIACNLAKANAKSDIAGEITTFISKSLASSTEGQASINENNPQVEGLRSFVENTLAEKVQAMLVGAAVAKTYWEKRNYKQSKGAKRDFIGYTCAALIRMKKETIQNAIDRVGRILDKKTDDAKTKANVKKAIKDANDNFGKIMNAKTIRG
jgi:hypothetical protein